MLTELTGDLLLSSAHVIAHGVAPNDHFDHGLALALRERWPALAKDFRHHCRESHPSPGEIVAWGGADGRRIYSLLTQEAAATEGPHPGRAKLEYVNHALRALRKALLDDGRVRSLALPRLATGVGALPWTEVQPLIRQHLGDLPFPVYVYATYRKGEVAHEG